MLFLKLGSGTIVLLVVGVLVVLLVIWLIGAYNKLVQLRNKVRNGWSQIDVQLKRRFDLIPNLAETVKGYANLEKGILKNLHEQEVFMHKLLRKEMLKEWPQLIIL